MLRFPDQHFTAACLCNLASSNPSELTRKVAEIYLAKEMKPAAAAHTESEKTVQLRPEQLKSKVGLYWNPDGDEIRRITLKGDRLYISVGGGDDSYELKAASENKFRLVIAPVDFTFEKSDPAGSLRLIERQDDGKPEVFVAVPDFTPSASQLKDYAGVYKSEEIEPLYEIRVDQGRLVLHRLKNKPDALQPITRDLFAASRETVHFTRNAQGDVSGFMLSTGRIRNFRFAKPGSGRQLLHVRAAPDSWDPALLHARVVAGIFSESGGGPEPMIRLNWPLPPTFA
jgi:hypothetical protein